MMYLPNVRMAVTEREVRNGCITMPDDYVKDHVIIYTRILRNINLQNLKRAIIVGEKTAGGSVKLDKIKVGDTDFYVTVPTAKSINPITGTSWEVTGVTPNVEVNAEDALATALKIVHIRVQVPAIIEGSAALIAENYAFEDVGLDVAEKLKGLLANGEYDTVVSKENLEVKLSADLKTLSGDKCLKTTSNTPVLPPMVRPLYIRLLGFGWESILNRVLIY